MSEAVSCGFFVLPAIEITSTRYTHSDIPEPDPTRPMGDGTTGEVVWVSGTSYPINRRVIVPSTHRVYRDTMGGVSNVRPDLEPLRWFDEGPTNRWAWTDMRSPWRSVGPSPLHLRLQPGAISDIEIMGMRNVNSVRVQILDGAEGFVSVFDRTYLTDDVLAAEPHWALYFQAPMPGETISISGLPVYPEGEVVLTFVSTNGQAVGVGLIAPGSYQQCGIAEIGFEARYVPYGYDVIDRWGNINRVKAPKGKELRGTAYAPIETANAIDRLVLSLLEQPAVFVPSLQRHHRFLKTAGFIEPVVMGTPVDGHVVMTIEVRGFAVWQE
jgi:hypothetical protein